MATTGWSSCPPMGGTGRLQFATVPTMLYGLSDTEKAGHRHLSPRFIGQPSWPAAPAAPEGTVTTK